MLPEVGRGVRGSECSVCRIFIFLMKENWIYASTRHHAEWNIDILLTRNLPIASDIREWLHPLMMSSYCLGAKSNNRTRVQLECDMTWFCFCFDFVRSHVRCGCWSIERIGWVRLKLDVQGQEGRKMLEVDEQGVESLEY